MAARAGEGGCRAGFRLEGLRTKERRGSGFRSRHLQPQEGRFVQVWGLCAAAGPIKLGHDGTAVVERWLAAAAADAE